MATFQNKSDAQFKQETNEKDFQNSPNNKNNLTENFRKCPNCGWNVSGTADICENCGEWLLKGQCNFCYAKIELGQKFCSECGNPPEGIICGTCGEISHFDFCAHCNIPLTQQAYETIELLKITVEFQSLLQVDDKSELKTDDNIHPDNSLENKFKDDIYKVPESKSPKTNFFTLNIRAKTSIENNIRSLEQSRHNISEEEHRISLQKQKERDAIKLLEEIRNKTFSSNQEARKFYGALKILLPRVIEKKNPVGWTCNAYDVTHSDGPQGCADPSRGGTWVYTISKETSFEATEI